MPPDTIAHYKILERIGSGTLGEIFRARDTKVGRTVALRLVDPSLIAEPARRRTLLSDARAAAQLSHPNVAALFDVGEEGERVFLAFENVTGETLRAVIGDRPLNPRRAADVGVQVADALVEGHRLGIVHGDLRPDNILITSSGRPKIVDFGLSAWANAAHPQSRSRTGKLATRFAYVSPEQALGEAGDSRSDIFSLGVVLFEMLTGRSPFKANTAEETLVQVVQVVPPRPSSVSPRVPPELDAIVESALRKSLTARCQDAGLLASSLRTVVASLDAARSAQPSTPMTAGRRAAPKSRRTMVGVMILLLVLALIAISLWFSRRDQLQLQHRTPITTPAVSLPGD